MRISEIVASYMANNVGSMLDEPTVGKLLMLAIRMYAGHATISDMPPLCGVVHSAVSPDDDNFALNDFDLNLSELSIIRPLFDLYCEHGNAIMLEASRSMGIDAYGRSSSEVSGDVKEYEMALPRMAFYCQPELI